MSPRRASISSWGLPSRTCFCCSAAAGLCPGADRRQGAAGRHGLRSVREPRSRCADLCLLPGRALPAHLDPYRACRTLAPEGGQHQSVNTPLSASPPTGSRALNRRNVDELAILLRHAFVHMQEPDGSAVWLRLSTRQLDQPERRARSGGGYCRRAIGPVPPTPGARIAIAYQGPVAPEAWRGVRRRSSSGRDGGGPARDHQPRPAARGLAGGAPRPACRGARASGACGDTARAACSRGRCWSQCWTGTGRPSHGSAA